MKLITLLVPCAFASSLAFASPVQRTGTIDVSNGYDANYSFAIKRIHVEYSTDNDDAVMEIEGEGKLSATRENSQISGYVSSPKKYFFYKLDLNPKTARSSRGKQTVILEEKGASTFTCNEDANALLTAYKGDGTSKNFCVVLK